MEYKKGDIIEFNIYGKTVVGTFIEMNGNSIIIKTTKDFIKPMIGVDQSINKSHPHKILKTK